MDKGSKIYVAGHRGLVGSAIIRNLHKNGYNNIICRTRSELDLLNSKEVIEFFQKEKPEIVFLAAAKVGGIMANNIYRADFLYENLMIQNNVIHQAYLHGVKKLLFLGSTCIYPKNCPQPIKEDYLLTDVLEYTNEPYAIAKIAGIKLCESYNIQYGTNFLSVMPANLYGPNDNFDLEKSHVLPALMRKMHLGRLLEKNDEKLLRLDLDQLPIGGINGQSNMDKILDVLEKHGVIKSAEQVQVEIWGTGKPMREFLWSEDLAQACVYLMENINFTDLFSDPSQPIRNTHLNIGTGEDISISNLAQLIKQVIGFKGNLIFNTDKPDGTMRKLTDVSKIKALGWHHSVDLDEGINLMYDHYLSRFQIATI